MKAFISGTGKPIIIEYADDLEVLKLDFPLSYHLLMRHREGRLTSRFHASCTALSIRLRRRRDALEAWTPSDRLRRLGREIDGWLKVLVVCAALYFFIEVIRAFVRGDVERVMGAGR